MRRLIFVFALLGPLIGPAVHGQVQVDRVATPVLGADPAANVSVLQAAIDTVATAGGGVVHLSPGRFRFAAPVFLDRSRVTLAGAGRTATELVPTGSYAGPVLIAGFARAPAGAPVPGPDLRPEITALLDGSAGRRWGLHLDRGRHLAVVGTPLDRGPLPGVWGTPGRGWYDSGGCYSLDIALAADGGGVLPDGAVCGTDTFGSPSPVALKFQSGQVQVLFTAAGDPPRSYRLASFPLGGATGLVRLGFELDLPSHAFTAYVGGAQVAASVRPETWANLGPDARLAPNVWAPFMVGSSGGYALASGPETWGALLDRVTVCGLRVGLARRYADTGPGTPQTLLARPGVAATDAHRYFGTNPAGDVPLAVLPLDAPEPAPTFLISAGGRRRLGYVVERAHATDAARPVDLVVRDLALINSDVALPVGSSLHLDIERVDLLGYVQGLGSLGALAYPIRLDDCKVAGMDCGVVFDEAIADLHQVDWTYVGRHGLRARNTAFSMEGGFVNGFGDPDLFCLSRGSVARLRGLAIDFEDGVHPRAGFIQCEAIAGSPAGNLLALDGLTVGPLGGPLARLTGTAGGSVSVQRLLMQGNGRLPILAVDGPGWAGTLDLGGVANPDRVEATQGWGRRIINLGRGLAEDGNHDQ